MYIFKKYFHYWHTLFTDSSSDDGINKEHFHSLVLFIFRNIKIKLKGGRKINKSEEGKCFENSLRNFVEISRPSQVDKLILLAINHYYHHYLSHDQVDHRVITELNI